VRNPLKNKLDYRDLLATPSDGKRYELLDGEVVVTAAPTPGHQRCVLEMTLRFVEYFRGRDIAEVFVSPIDVILAEQDVVEPDIVVVSDPAQVSKRGIEGPPLVVVEVLSPSTRASDRTIKAQRYARLGIAHYWIVDPEERRVECFRERGGVYELVAAAEADRGLTHPDWPGLLIELGALWRSGR
jgi:Uma2 family endonuclease